MFTNEFKNMSHAPRNEFKAPHDIVNLLGNEYGKLLSRDVGRTYTENVIADATLLNDESRKGEQILKKSETKTVSDIEGAGSKKLKKYLKKINNKDYSHIKFK